MSKLSVLCKVSVGSVAPSFLVSFCHCSAETSCIQPEPAFPYSWLLSTWPHCSSAGIHLAVLDCESGAWGSMISSDTNWQHDLWGHDSLPHPPCFFPDLQFPHLYKTFIAEHFEHIKHICMHLSLGICITILWGKEGFSGRFEEVK